MPAAAVVGGAAGEVPRGQSQGVNAGEKMQLGVLQTRTEPLQHCVCVCVLGRNQISFSRGALTARLSFLCF